MGGATIPPAGRTPRGGHSGARASEIRVAEQPAEIGRAGKSPRPATQTERPA